MKYGILGGTFDPVHAGHMLVAVEARRRLGLDGVIFIPAGVPRFKETIAVTPAKDRLRMLQLAVAGNAHFSVSDMEIRRPGVSYTVDTLKELKKLHPDDELYFILGWDNLERLKDWQEPAEILHLAQLVAVPRVGHPKPDVKRLSADLPGLDKRSIFLDQPQVEISASGIRQRAAGGVPFTHLVAPAVERYISEHQLYQVSGAQKES